MSKDERVECTPVEVNVGKRAGGFKLSDAVKKNPFKSIGWDESLLKALDKTLKRSSC